MKQKSKSIRSLAKQHRITDIILWLMLTVGIQTAAPDISGKYKVVFENKYNSPISDFVWKEYVIPSKYGQTLFFHDNSFIHFIMEKQDDPSQWISGMKNFGTVSTITIMNHPKVDFIVVSDTDKTENYLKIFGDPSLPGNVKLAKVGTFDRNKLEIYGTVPDPQILQFDENYILNIYHQDIFAYEIDHSSIDLNPLVPPASVKITEISRFGGAILTGDRFLKRIFMLEKKMIFLVKSRESKQDYIDFCIYSTNLSSLVDKTQAVMVEEDCFNKSMKSPINFSAVQMKENPNLLIVADAPVGKFYRVNVLTKTTDKTSFMTAGNFMPPLGSYSPFGDSESLILISMNSRKGFFLLNLKTSQTIFQMNTKDGMINGNNGVVLGNRQGNTIMSTGESTDTQLKLFSNKEREPCHKDCYSCTGDLSTNCSLCAPGTYPKADFDMFSEKLDVVCKASCHSNCQLCGGVSIESCIKCVEGLFGDCSLTDACSLTCQSCFGPEANQCLSCSSRSDYLLSDNTCGSCPVNHTTSPTSGVCEVCSSNCLTCSSSPSHCTSCVPALLFSEDSCQAIPEEYKARFS